MVHLHQRTWFLLWLLSPAAEAVLVLVEGAATFSNVVSKTTNQMILFIYISECGA